MTVDNNKESTTHSSFNIDSNGLLQHLNGICKINNEKLGRIIVASNTLPISVSREADDGESPQGASSSSLSSSMDLSSSSNGTTLPIKISTEPFPIESALNCLMNKGDIKDYVWVGWPHCEVQEEEIPAHSEAIKAHSPNFVPIFLDSKLISNHYKGFCKNGLWSLLHYQLNFVRLESEWWDSYVQVNQMFADKIAEIWKPGDYIWVHDYHLMLLPHMLRQVLPKDAAIGFFFHAPFPSYELFRILPNRKEMLRGILGSNLIGFQSFEYLRHFRSSCARLLDLEVLPKGLEMTTEKYSIFVKLQVYPIGVDYTDFVNNLNLPIVSNRVQKLREIFKGKRVIVARDRLDQIEGVPRKLEVIETLLSEHPEYQGKLVFIQIYEPTVEENEETEEQKCLHRTVNEMVGRINGRFGKLNFNPIEYINRKIAYEELSALYKLADIALITPIRDGMNLTSHEYVVCQKDTHGVLILSEFTGAARCLGGSIIVNPFSKKEMTSAIIEALNMKKEDRRLKHQINYNYVLANTSSFWAKRFLWDLLEMMLSEAKESKVPLVDIPTVISHFDHSKKRVLLLDYDGTLTPLVRHPNLAIPSKQLIESLLALCKDPRNDIYVISGRDRVSLENWLGQIPVGLSCEHGGFFRPPGENQQWVENPKAETSWKENVLSIMQDFEDRTPGSFVEHKQINLTWHYRNADPDYGKYQARELVAQLHAVANKFPLDILVGKKAIEVKPIGINKGEIVKTILHKCDTADFILCIGDDKTDEDMFKALIDSEKSITIKVTSDKKESTKAKSTIEDCKDVINLLSRLSELTVKS
eukprot:gene2771-3445_t